MPLCKNRPPKSVGDFPPPPPSVANLRTATCKRVLVQAGSVIRCAKKKTGSAKVAAISRRSGCSPSLGQVN